MIASAGPLFTDLYELTMMAGYLESGRNPEATFSLYIRPNPHRNFFISAGLGPALENIRNLRFSETDIRYLEGLGLFSKAVLDGFSDFRFTGTIRAIAEGTLIFGNEPVMEVTAPIMEAQLLETYLINTIGMATLAASKGARCMLSAKGRPLVDFSLRRTQGMDAGLHVARSTYMTGFAGTSNVEAGRRLGIPVSGTMAHSWVTSFADEQEAFRSFSATFPDHSILLIDTYDSVEGAKKAVATARELEARGKRLKGVRIDSGDMVAQSRVIRKILDDAGLA